MNILCVTNMYPSAGEPQFGSFVRDQVDDLQKGGVRVEVLAFDGRPARTAYARAALDVRRRISDGFDLVHAHYGLSGAVALSQRTTPIFTTFYGSDVGFIRWQRRVSWFVARATSPIFVSEVIARRLGLGRSRIIPTAVDTALFRPTPTTEARMRLGWEPDALYVLLPGSRSSAVKGPKLFDTVVAALRGRTSAAVVPISLERIARADVALLMNAVDVTLMTSWSEGSPVAVKESLACGTPVVSVDVGDVATVINGLPGCSIRRREVDDLAAGVEAAVRQGKNADLRARAEEYSRPVIARRLIRAFEDSPPR